MGSAVAAACMPAALCADTDDRARPAAGRAVAQRAQGAHQQKAELDDGADSPLLGGHACRAVPLLGLLHPGLPLPAARQALLHTGSADAQDETAICTSPDLPHRTDHKHFGPGPLQSIGQHGTFNAAISCKCGVWRCLPALLPCALYQLYSPPRSALTSCVLASGLPPSSFTHDT